MRLRSVITLAIVSVFVFTGVFIIFNESSAAKKTTVTAAKAKKDPSGINDKSWKKAKSTVIQLEGKEEFEGMSVLVETKAIYTKTNIHFLFKWKDKTKSIIKGAWKFDGQKWAHQDGNEDRLALLFEITRIKGFPSAGCAATCHAPDEGDIQMATGKKGEKADLWHWKAARSDPYKSAEDTWLGVGGVKTGRKADAGKGGDKKNQTEDKSKPAYMQNPGTKPSAPGFLLAEESVVIKDYSVFKAGDVLTYRMPKKPKGSRGDIKAISNYADGFWTLMLTRKLKTGHSDDVAFNVRKKYNFALATFDNSSDENSYDSEVVLLKFK